MNNENDKIVENALEDMEQQQVLRRAQYEWETSQMVNEAIKKAFERDV